MAAVEQIQRKDDDHKKKSQGKRKIAIEIITDKTRKQVTFSKRRKGLFKKASELCSLTDAQVAIVTFSGAGKVYPFGHPSADSVIQRYLSNYGHKKDCDDQKNNGFWWDKPIDDLGVTELDQLKVKLQDLRTRVLSRVDEINEKMTKNNNYITNDQSDLRLRVLSRVDKINEEMKMSNNYITNDQSVDFDSMDWMTIQSLLSSS